MATLRTLLLLLSLLLLAKAEKYLLVKLMEEAAAPDADETTENKALRAKAGTLRTGPAARNLKSKQKY